MKAIFYLILIAVLILLGVSYRIARMQVACADAYQPQITDAVSQSQAIFADKRRSCERSYYAINDLEMCLSKTDSALPPALMNALRPVVSNVSVFIRNEQKDIAAIQREHDTRCGAYSQFRFFTESEQ